MQNSNKNDVYSNNRELEKRKKQDYRHHNEQALDSIVSAVLSAESNGIEPQIDNADKSTVVRYYNRYWSNQFISTSFVVLLTTGILSFFTPFASLGIAIVSILNYIYSQNIFLRFYLNDHGLTPVHMQLFKNSIFKRALKSKNLLIFTIILLSISAATYVNTQVLFLHFNAFSFSFPVPFINIMISGSYAPGNELFAYINMVAISFLILLKIIEKWKL